MADNPFSGLRQQDNPFSGLRQQPSQFRGPAAHVGYTGAAVGAGALGSLGSTLSGMEWLTGIGAFGRGSEALHRGAEGLMGFVPEDLQDQYWYSHVAPGVGSLASYIGPGIAARGVVRAAQGAGRLTAGTGISTGERVAQFGTAGAMAAPAGIDEQLQRVRGFLVEHPELGLTEQDFSGRIALGSIGGLVQIANLGRFINPIMPKHGRGVVMADVLRRAGEAGVSEAIVESGGALIQNVLEKSYNVERGVLDDLAARGGTGGIVGFIGGLAMAPYTGRSAARPGAKRITADEVKKRVADGQNPMLVMRDVLENIDPARLDEAARRGEFKIEGVVLDQVDRLPIENIPEGPGDLAFRMQARGVPLDIDTALDAPPLDAVFQDQGREIPISGRPLETELAWQQQRESDALDAQLRREFGWTRAEEQRARQREREEAEARYQRELQPDPTGRWFAGVDAERGQALPADDLPSNPAMRIAFERARAGVPQTPFEEGVAAAEALAPETEAQAPVGRARPPEPVPEAPARPLVPETAPEAPAEPRRPTDAVSTEELAQVRQDGQWVPFPDARLKRPDFRHGLQSMAARLTPGRLRKVFIEGGEGRGGDMDVYRPPSTNPGWFQSMSEDGISVADVRRAVQKALAGEKLYSRQQRIIENMLHTISGGRMGFPVDAPTALGAPYGPDFVDWRDGLAQARELRRQARQEMPDPAAEQAEAQRDETAGMRYGDDFYAEDMGSVARVMLEMAEDARAVDEAAAIEALRADRDLSETANRLWRIEHGQRDTGRQEDQGPGAEATGAQQREDLSLERQPADPARTETPAPEQPGLIPGEPTETTQAVHRRRQETDQRLRGEETVAPDEGEGRLFVSPEHDVAARQQELAPTTEREQIRRGTEPMVQRQENARERFINVLVEDHGLTRQEANAATNTFIEDGLLTLDPNDGQFHVTTGRVFDADVLQRAARQGQEAAPAEARIGRAERQEEESRRAAVARHEEILETADPVQRGDQAHVVDGRGPGMRISPKPVLVTRVRQDKAWIVHLDDDGSPMPETEFRTDRDTLVTADTAAQLRQAIAPEAPTELRWQAIPEQGANLENLVTPEGIQILETADQAPQIRGIPDDAGPMAMAFDPLTGEGYVVLEHAGDQAAELVAELAGRKDGLDGVLGETIRRRLERVHGEDLAAVFADTTMAGDPTVQMAINRARNVLEHQHGFTEISDDVAMGYLRGAADSSSLVRRLGADGQRTVRRADKRARALERLRECLSTR